MFKIFRLKIRGIEPFHEKEDFTFGPFFTLIRGGNGAGKTTVLESLALLGHCSVMEYSDELTSHSYDDRRHNCYVKYTIILGKCPFDAFEGEEEVECLAKDWKKLLGTRPYTEIIIRIFHKDNETRDDLKKDLKDENLLKREWKIAGKKEEVEFIQNLVAFSRPAQTSSETEELERLIKHTLQSNENKTGMERIENAAKEIMSVIGNAKPRFARPDRSKYLDATHSLPPFICYFNTDMYHYGLGLDIRESPKHLSEELSSLVKDRLHLVAEDLGVIRNFWKVKEFWDITYEGDNKEILDLIWFDEEDKAHIVITVEDENVREFLSSGENQTLSLGLIFGALRPSHSIIMLDEPDLHLSLPAALRMYNEIFNRSLRDNIQIIAVSHLPFIFPQALYEKEEIIDSESFHGFHLNMKEQTKPQNNNSHPGSRPSYTPLRCLTLYYLNKKTEDGKVTIELKRQKEAAEEAGKYQNDEIDSILMQSKADSPTLTSIFKDSIRLVLNKK